MASTKVVTTPSSSSGTKSLRHSSFCCRLLVVVLLTVVPTSRAYTNLTPIVLSKRRTLFHMKRRPSWHTTKQQQPTLRKNPVRIPTAFSRYRVRSFISYNDNSNEEEIVEEEEYDDDEEEEEDREVVAEYDEGILIRKEDTDDENYVVQMNEIQRSIAARKMIDETDQRLRADSPIWENMVPEFLEEQLTPEQNDRARLLSRQFEISPDDDVTVGNLTNSINNTHYDTMDMLNFQSGPDAFPSDDDFIMKDSGIKNSDLVRLEDALKDLVGTYHGWENGTMIDNKQAMIDPEIELEKLDNETYEELISAYYGVSADDNNPEKKNSFVASNGVLSDNPFGWLLYDLNFNVTDLVLAACHHNPRAPIIFNHWFPQLAAYKRYASVRERDFRFTWDDAEKADMSQLERYYAGLGYDQIPTKLPSETGVVEVESEFDEDDVSMAAFENWMAEVYDPEREDLYFDDEAFQPEDSVYDKQYGRQESDTVKKFMADYKDFREEFAQAGEEYMDSIATVKNYTYVVDEEGAAEFRGHLVVACSASDEDLEMAERITLTCQREFGKKVFVETRVYNHARQEDNVYEIWLESYDIELLHSKRKAIYNTNQWDGPADLDDTQLTSVMDRIRFLISDECRYSYRLHEFVTEV